MRITGITSYHSNIYNTSKQNMTFCSSGRFVYRDLNDSVTKSQVWNTSTPYRNDIDWDWLASFLDYNFRDKDKVNMINLACSDGSEPYTMAIALKENIPIAERRNKFCPIKASDADDGIIRVAKSGRINLLDEELKMIEVRTNARDSYFSNPSFAINVDNDADIIHYKSYTPNAYLRNFVSFEHSDIISQLEKLKDDGNSVVFCRNVTPYLEDNYLQKTINLFNEKLKKGSVLVLGDLENNTGVKKRITKTFECIDYRNVFRRL